jgi:tetratricopeptide (TPR) repeat protein
MYAAIQAYEKCLLATLHLIHPFDGNSFKTYQEALSYCEQGQLSPLVRSRIYAASAPTFATNGYVKEAYSLIEKAYDSFPVKLDSEPIAFSADNQLFMIDYYQGLLYLVVNQPEKAYQTFEQAIVRPYESQIPERWRLIILNYQGLAAIEGAKKRMMVDELEMAQRFAFSLWYDLAQKMRQIQKNGKSLLSFVVLVSASNGHQPIHYFVVMAKTCICPPVTDDGSVTL